MTKKVRQLAEGKYGVVGKNWIHNGAFNHAQRGTSFDGLGDKYTLDRWFFYDGTGDNATVSRAGTSTDSPWGLTTVMRIETTNVAGINTSDNAITIAQLHDDWNELAAPSETKFGVGSNTVTVSFNIRRTAAGGGVVANPESKARVQMFRVLKTDRDGNNSRNFLRNGVFWTGEFDFTENGEGGNISSNWTNSRKVFTFDIPYAADRDSYYYGILFEFGGYDLPEYSGFWTANGENLYISGLKLERGAVASDFIQEDVTTELQTMQRYYEASDTEGNRSTSTGHHYTWFGTAWTPSSSSVTPCCTSINFRVVKRRRPTILIYNSGTGAVNEIRWSGGLVGANAVPSEWDTKKFYVRALGTGNPHTSSYFHWTADAEI